MKEIFNMLEFIYSFFDILSILIVVIGFPLFWRYLTKRTEAIAEMPVQKKLKEFQLNLDNEHEKFKTIHQKQLMAVHEINKKFKDLILTFRYLVGNENFTQPLEPKQEMEKLIKSRNTFKRTYFLNKHFLPNGLCQKIEKNLAQLDDFIKTYQNGLFQEAHDNESSSDLIISGLWTADELDPIKENLDKIAKELETEFRKIYGT